MPSLRLHRPSASTTNSGRRLTKPPQPTHRPFSQDDAAAAEAGTNQQRHPLILGRTDWPSNAARRWPSRAGSPTNTLGSPTGCHDTSHETGVVSGVCASCRATGVSNWRDPGSRYRSGAHGGRPRDAAGYEVEQVERATAVAEAPHQQVRVLPISSSSLHTCVSSSCPIVGRAVRWRSHEHPAR